MTTTDRKLCACGELPVSRRIDGTDMCIVCYRGICKECLAYVPVQWHMPSCSRWQPHRTEGDWGTWGD